MAETLREQRGRTVRETWVTWAKHQRNPKPSWLTGWDDLDADQREVDMLIGEAVAEGERRRADVAEKRLAEEIGSMCPGCDAFRAFLEDLRSAS
jgi:hypothetical protein